MGIFDWFSDDDEIKAVPIDPSKPVGSPPPPETNAEIVSQSFSETEILYLDANGNVVRREPLTSSQQKINS